MALRYDPDANAAYINLLDVRVRVTKTLSGDSPDIAGMIGFLNFDFDESGALVGIEVLNANRILPARLLQP